MRETPRNAQAGDVAIRWGLGWDILSPEQGERSGKADRTTTILTGKAAEAFEEYMLNAKPSEAKREMVAKAKKVRDAMKRLD